MFHLRTLTTLAVALGIALNACSSEGNPHTAATVTKPKEPEARKILPVDYTAGRIMNERIGKGINLGNAWDSKGNRLDSSWGNPISDSDFAFVKQAGFNSVRIPVRWQVKSDYTTHTVEQRRLDGVKEDIQLAIDQGLVVIVNFHHYEELNQAGNKYSTDPAAYEAEKKHFLGMWAQVAKAMDDEFPDSMLVLEILNEPTISNAELVDQLMNDAYQVIRAAAPGKTIMFESYHAAKFADLDILHLPADGNIIYSGHYYEPFNYSHQGHSYACKGDDTYANTATSDLSTYVQLAKSLYPDINGKDYIPLNMGEFGVSGGTSAASRGACKDKENDPLPSANMKALWAKQSIQAAETFGVSWNYWGLVGVGGFEAAQRTVNGINWFDGFPTAFGL